MGMSTTYKIILCIIFAITFTGIGSGMTFAFLLTDHPSIIIEEKWRVVTTAPPVTYLPETPFHIDPKVICDPYAPPTTPSTSVRKPPVKRPAPTTGSTRPPSTQPPSSTTSPPETTVTTAPSTTTSAVPTT